ncbi:PDC sensor domain-containing protein, partial [bacterium]|nr:PDC sensor domain-containing protein [bacterium]
SSIQELDEKWKAKTGIADYMQVLMDNTCGKYLRELQNVEPYIAEAFAMDNQGANVCMTDKTSDYWQGDEAKFKNSWNGGKGGIFVDDVEFDDSAQTYVTQVSVPVVDGGKVIGAITFGVDIDKL